MSQGSPAGYQFDTARFEERVAYDGSLLEEVNISERQGRGHLSYTCGVDIIGGPLGDLTLTDTVSLDLVQVIRKGEARRHGLGTALMREFIEQAKEADFQYARALIIHPFMVKLIEGRLRAGQLRDRVFYQSSDLLWDAPSAEVTRQVTPLAPDLAASLVADPSALNGVEVNCLMSL